MPCQIPKRVKHLTEIAKLNATNREHMPMFFVPNDEKKQMMIVAAIFEDDETKEMTITAMKRALYNTNAEYYIFISEGYRKQVTDQEALRHISGERIKDMPGRIEVLNICYVNRDGYSKMWSYPIKGELGNRTFDKPLVMDNKEGALSGNFVIKW
jgi:hypothetical protein